MIDALSLAVTLGCVAVMFAGVVVTARGRSALGKLGGPLVAIELALLVQAVLAVVGLARGHRPAELATFVAYLVFSVVVIPVAAANVRGDAGRWAGAVIVIALLVQAVIVVRLQTSWRSA